MKKAIVLVSGGLDSATCLAIAQAEGYACYALSFDYGQRSASELNAAARLSETAGVIAHKTLPIDMGAIGGSALTDRSIAVPEEETVGIPVTYVPARNTVFLSYALAWAEVVEAEAIFIGVNALDYSGYPDCRPEYIDAFQSLINLATKAGVEGKNIVLRTPLIDLTKAEIIGVGLKLGVNYAATVSCYQPASEDFANITNTTNQPAEDFSYALAWAEVVEAEAIFIGVNALDYSGYPDCRPEYIDAFQSLINLATKAGVEGKNIVLRTPLIDLTKAEIIGVGLKLGVNYAATVSCYQADAEGRACGLCDSCRLRTKGFADAQSQDPTRYR